MSEEKTERGRWTNSKTCRRLRSDAYIGWPNRDKFGVEPVRYLRPDDAAVAAMHAERVEHEMLAGLT